ncbi:hypothetical protein [Cellulomonas sp. ATA003]|uniref:hypothetical protein n=1 Tax=Cellulomonas sp. ATA003 TaxID=3073064 RepID=UPI0028739521|nr:hypothetical protein [Cellulomonas sp. ATA003]WNB86529.1 hypothetical protein REH70_04655 [Cellulomonas sp. ATA003]
MSNDVVLTHDTANTSTVNATAPGSGERLWRFRPAGPDTGPAPGTTLGRGAVAMLSRPLGHNPLLPRTDRDQVTVLDATTGTVTGMLRAGRVWDIAPTAPGQALVVTEERTQTGDRVLEYVATLVGPAG